MNKRRNDLMNECTLRYSAQFLNYVASEALRDNQGLRLKKVEFYVAYECLTTRLTSGGCVEESSVG